MPRTRSRHALGCLATLTLLVALAPTHAGASNHLMRGYKNLQNITPDDFKGSVPAGDTHDAKTVTQIAPVIDVPHTFKQPRRVDTPQGKRWIFEVDTLEWKTLEFETQFDTSRSWWKDKTNRDATLLAHEKGHIGITEWYAHQLNAKKAALIKYVNDLPKVPDIAVRDTGQSEDEARKEAEKTLNDVLLRRAGNAGRAVGTAEAAEYRKQQGEGDGSYDKESNHGKNPAGQAAWEKKIAECLSEELKQPAADSTSTRSLHFDAAAGLLSLTNDVITGIDGAASLDPIVGADVLFDDYILEGLTLDGGLLFGAADDGHWSVTKGGSPFIEGDLPYLIYHDNRFSGWFPTAVFDGAGSPFVGGLEVASLTHSVFLLGIDILPDVDLAALTAGFTISGTATFMNLIGEVTVDELPVPEPSGLPFIAITIAALVVLRGRRAVMPGAR